MTDVKITPASGKIEFLDNSDGVDAKIETDASGNLSITNPSGDISLGDTSADVFIGDGTNNVDLVFDQDGSIRGVTGVNITLGQSDSDVTMATDLDFNNNDALNVNNASFSGTVTLSGSINYTPNTGSILKVDGQTILERTTENGALVFGHDDSMIVGAGEATTNIKANVSAAEERVHIGGESGVTLYGFKGNFSNGYDYDNRAMLHWGDKGLYVGGNTASNHVINTSGEWVGPGSGLKGETGQKGQKGVTGAKGNQGDKGQKGAQGDKGDTGQKGQKGVTGAKGDQGDKGNQHRCDIKSKFQTFRGTLAGSIQNIFSV